MSADFFTKQEDVAVEPVPRPTRLSGPEKAIVVIVAVTLTLACLVISSRPQKEDGQLAWRSGSLLQPITQLMALNFEYPTAKGVEVKWLVHGLGVAAALAVAAAGWYAASKPREPELRPEGVRPPRSLRDRMRFFFVSAAPSTAAQMALVLFGAWMFLSALWAPWPAGAVGEACRYAISIVWAIVLGRALSVRAARTAAMCLVGALTLAATIGIWYFIERNPGQRLKFPIGNPIFMAACLLPGLMLGGAWVVGWLAGLVAPASAGAPQKGGPGAAGGAVAAVAGRVPLWLAIGSVLCLAFVAWAFLLAGSRGPALGFVGGAVVVGLLAAPRYGRWIIGVLAIVGIVLIVMWAKGRLAEDSDRAATMRFRTYAWRYAIDRVAYRPVTGGGQGSYLLSAQGMSLSDVEKDPAAFPGGLLGHAHNEWLEVLSDLGAAGFALIATALGITLWGAGLAWRKLPGWLDRCTLLALGGALGAMIVEELTDSTLRTAVFPLIFFTVVGLIWAMAAATEKKPAEATEPGHSAGVRSAGLLLGMLGAVAIAWLGVMDWQGARADYRAGEKLEKQDWDGAVAEAAAAQTMRMDVQDRLMAIDREGRVAQEAAEYWYGEFGQVISRAQAAGTLPPSALQVALENADRFNKYFDVAQAADKRVLAYMPYFMDAAQRLAGLTLLKGEQEQFLQRLGVNIKPVDRLGDARQLLKLEYERDPFNPSIGLRLLELLPDSVPMADRLQLLRSPLRAGPVQMGVTVMLNELMKQEDFKPTMREWMAAAQVAVRDRKTEWADRYAPETLRLQALVRELERLNVQGAAGGLEAIGTATKAMDLAKEAEVLSGEAADLLMQVRARFPTAAAYARADQAKYRLWAAPRAPEAAIEIYRQALAAWPVSGSKERGEVMQAGLSIFLLAAGKEDEARQHLRKIYPQGDEKMQDVRVAAGFQELGQWFINVPSLARPPQFRQMVARWVELDPTTPVARLMAAQLALEQHNDAEAMAHIDALRTKRNRQQFAETIRFLLEHFPDSEALQFMARRMAGAEAAPVATRAGADDDE